MISSDPQRRFFILDFFSFYANIVLENFVICPKIFKYGISTPKLSPDSRKITHTGLFWCYVLSAPGFLFNFSIFMPFLDFENLEFAPKSSNMSEPKLSPDSHQILYTLFRWYVLNAIGFFHIFFFVFWVFRSFLDFKNLEIAPKS